MSIDRARQEIQHQKELPVLSPNIQRILETCEDPGVTQGQLAAVLMETPTIAARLLGMANSAFFGQAGKIHSLNHAISVLGLVTVRSVAVGLALAGEFDTARCPHFHAERYWVSAVMTATLANQLRSALPETLRPPGDSIYIAGLLHNMGLLALVHLHRREMDAAFVAYAADPAVRLGEHIRARLDVDHYQAGVWLGSKWHLPDDILLVMEYHYDLDYRGTHWPLVLLEGVCARLANGLLDGRPPTPEDEASLSALGVSTASLEDSLDKLTEKLDAIRDLAAQFGRS